VRPNARAAFRLIASSERLGISTGISAGFFVWFYTLILPALGKEEILGHSFLSDGPFGMWLLRRRPASGVTFLVVGCLLAAERFGVELPEIRAVLVNLHTAVIGQRPRMPLQLLGRDPAQPAASRRAWFDGGWLDAPVYQREALPPVVTGPAIIEQLDCTTLIEPGCRVERDRLANLIITV